MISLDVTVEEMLCSFYISALNLKHGNAIGMDRKLK